MADEIVLLHGLESAVDENLRPIGSKARFMRERYSAATPGLDTRAAVAHRDWCVANQRPWDADPERVAAAFAAPMANARAAITAHTRLIVGSSFGGAVLLKLLHEAPRYAGPCVFMAGAGVMITPYDHIPEGVRAVLMHGRGDDEIAPGDSRTLFASSGPGVQLWELHDGHRLLSTLDDGTLDAAIQLMLSG